jgi:dipeptidyl aminopeptidase/acylaminoacyl peptidase
VPTPDGAAASRVTSTPYGTWASPVSARSVAASAVRLGGVAIDGDDIYWMEGRPEQGGRQVIVTRGADGRASDVTGETVNVRTRVNEYGGAAYVVSRGVIYYSEFTDQRLYRLERGGAPKPLTPAGDWFYADASIDHARRRLICVREDHTGRGQPATTLVSISLDEPGGPGDVVVSGHDFYAAPRLSPDGSHLSWLAWRHPQMPWDGTEVWVADVADEGTLAGATRIAGGERESIYQPDWSPDGTLYFVSDRTGWWNLCRWANGRVEPVQPMPADFGRAQWALGGRTWVFAGPSRLIAAYTETGRWRLSLIDLATGVRSAVLPDLEPTDSLAANERQLLLVAGSAREPDAVLRVNLVTGDAETLRVSSPVKLASDYVSVPEPIAFRTDGGRTAHAFHYRPQNPDAAAVAGERPPLIVICHGGPTAATHTRSNLEVQFWTSRGFAVVDVNYGGSTGYGREYRERLNGQWGVVDVGDCVSAARFLAARGDADGNRLVIRGRSAGGYTTLAALTFRPDVFKAGASYYGVSDLERLTDDTHKFESRYLDTLVGPYPAQRELYRTRSPIHWVDRLACPIIFFQGLEDRIVPPSQSKTMAAAVRAKGLPVALLTFEGEQHGFRRADNIARCLEAELAFYGAVFGFTPADRAEGFEIDNLASWR